MTAATTWRSGEPCAKCDYKGNARPCDDPDCPHRSAASGLSLVPEPAAYGRMVEREAGKVLLLTPAEAGRYDPPMQEWLALPVSEDGCPECGGEFWGTTNPGGYFLVRVCHNGCGAKFRGEVTTWTIQRIVEALNGQEVRLAR